MKTVIFIATLSFFSRGVVAQTGERFTVRGATKLIATWSGKTQDDVSGTLVSGDEIIIRIGEYGVGVWTLHNDVLKELVSPAYGEGEDMGKVIVKAYEYDFDDDGQNEIIIIRSPDFALLTVEVFRYCSGLTERVLCLNGSCDVWFEKNSIRLPMGRYGIGNEYIFINDSFYELVFHDPSPKEYDEY